MACINYILKKNIYYNYDIDNLNVIVHMLGILMI